LRALDSGRPAMQQLALSRTRVSDGREML